MGPNLTIPPYFHGQLGPDRGSWRGRKWPGIDPQRPEIDDYTPPKSMTIGVLGGSEGVIWTPKSGPLGTLKISHRVLNCSTFGFFQGPVGTHYSGPQGTNFWTLDPEIGPWDPGIDPWDPEIGPWDPEIGPWGVKNGPWG